MHSGEPRLISIFARNDVPGGISCHWWAEASCDTRDDRPPQDVIPSIHSLWAAHGMEKLDASCLRNVTDSIQVPRRVSAERSEGSAFLVVFTEKQQIPRFARDDMIGALFSSLSTPPGFTSAHRKGRQSRVVATVLQGQKRGQFRHGAESRGSVPRRSDF